ncbi:Helicase [Paraburkholderia sacchari]|uniref:AAA family ATPase n=1 Tax=Paraburkholderia sacchari TaxID=159450 RepID=UPI0039A5CDBD
MLNGHEEQERARSALIALDASCDRNEWVRVGMAFKAAGGEVDTWLQWCATGANYDGERAARSAWQSFKPNGGIGAGTLFLMARNAGWNGAQTRIEGAQGARASCPTVTASSKAQAAPKPRGNIAAAFANWPPASTEHPYIAAKRGNPDGLRVVPVGDFVSVGNQSVAGWLAVPVHSLDGELRTAQFIPPPGEGKKLNAPGASFGDGLFVVGEFVPDGSIHVVEGIGQAWACAKADYQAAAVVAFGAGRIRTVAKALRARYPAARIVIVADRGKETEAEAIAREVGGEWVAMPVDKPANYDANDFEAEHGIEALADLLRAAKTPPMRYRLQSADDLMSGPPLRWLVRGVLPADAFASLYGPSGSGKSFLALDMCVAIAEGAGDWFGRRVTRAPVTYCALEGESGMGKRAKAWSVRYSRALPANLQFVTQPLDLRNAEDVSDFASAVIAGGGQDGLIVIDTLNRAAPGSDENSSTDMSMLIAACKDLQRRTGCTVLLVHHTGKDSAKGLRGHSSLFAALDAAIEVKRDGSRRTLAVAKSKDDVDGECYAFSLQVVDLGEDESGEPVTSCVVVPDESPVVFAQAKPGGKTQRLVYALMDVLLSESTHFGKAGAPPGRPCVEFEAVVPVIAERMLCRPDQREYQVRRALKAMSGDGAIYQMRDGWIWVN